MSCRRAGAPPRSWEFLKTTHGEPDDGVEVAGLLQFTPMSLLTGTQLWSHTHIDELIIHPSLRRVRGSGVGAWLVAKWLAAQQGAAAADWAPEDVSEREAVWLSKPSARVVKRADGKFEPFVTLCVDEENAGARRFYQKLGLTELGPSPDRCPGRVEGVASLRTLQRSVRGLSENAPAVLGDAARRVRITYTGPELEELLFRTMRTRKPRVLFDAQDLAHARTLKDPAAMLAEMIADFYQDHFQTELESFVRDPDEPAALMPVGGRDVTKDVIRLFVLDRLLLWREPRVALTRGEWDALRGAEVYRPERTSAYEWTRTRYTVLFLHA